MLETLLWLISFQLLGETLARALHLPVPGAVIGISLLFLTLCARSSVPEKLGKGTSRILGHMSLFFVPAGVGVMAYTALLRPYLWPLTWVLAGLFLATLLGSAYLLRFMLRRGRRDERGIVRTVAIAVVWPVFDAGHVPAGAGVQPSFSRSPANQSAVVDDYWLCVGVVYAEY